MSAHAMGFSLLGLRTLDPPDKKKSTQPQLRPGRFTAYFKQMYMCMHCLIPLCGDFSIGSDLHAGTVLKNSSQNSGHYYTKREHVVGGSNMIGFHLVIALYKQDMSGIEPVPIGWHSYH